MATFGDYSEANEYLISVTVRKIGYIRYARHDTMFLASDCDL